MSGRMMVCKQERQQKQPNSTCSRWFFPQVGHLRMSIFSALGRTLSLLTIRPPDSLRECGLRWLLLLPTFARCL